MAAMHLPFFSYLMDSGSDPNSSALPRFFAFIALFSTMSAPSTLHRIKRKAPPSLDPADPFVHLWPLRNRTSSGLSRQDVPESDIVCRARSASCLYSTTTTAHVSPNSKTAHYSHSTLIDSSQAFPLISSLEQSVSDRPTNVRSPPRTRGLNDGTSSGTESDTASEPIHPPGSNHRFPKFLFKKTGRLNRSSIIDFKQARKSAVSPPVVSTVAWIHPASNDNSRVISKFTAALPADLDQTHQHPVSFDSKEQDLPKQCKLPTTSMPPKMSRKRRISSSIPFLSTTAPRKRSISSSSHVHISMPTPVLQSTLEDAYTSPRKAPVPPPVSPSNILSKECSDKSCGLGYNCIHSISSEWGLPSLLQLNYAACLPIIGENGEQITFGSLFETQRTIVIFIRHFWCPLCQDYMSSINSLIRPEMICTTCERDDDGHEETIRGIDHDPGTRVRFVVISNGAHGMIAKYRQIFGLTFKLYTDPSLAVYQALGMDKHRRVKHHNEQTDREISEKNSDINKPGGYVKHSLMGGIAMVVVRAFKVGMPVWEKGGDIDQLGGEFVFGPGLTCTYAHRMQTTKGHAPIHDILEAADILTTPNRNRTLSTAEICPAKPELSTIPDWNTSLTGSGKKERKRRESMYSIRDKGSARLHRATSRYSIGMMSQEDEDRWMEYRHDSIERLRAKKDIRRGITHTQSSQLHSSRPEHHQPLEMIGSNAIDGHRRPRSDYTSHR